MADFKDSCKTIILCGGRGTRLGKLGGNIPKTLIELHEKPILHHKLTQSINQGFTNFIIAIGYKGNMVVDACKKMDLKCKVDFSDSGEDTGMLQRICEAKKMFDERVIVTYGDSIANIQLQNLINFHLEKKSLATIVTAPIQSPFGLVTSDHDSRGLNIEEKPVLYYYIGTFVLEKKAMEFIPEEIMNWPDGTGLMAFFKILISVNKLYTYAHEGAEITFNTVEELDAAQKGFLKFYTHFK